jgi:hypothetical protein
LDLLPALCWIAAIILHGGAPSFSGYERHRYGLETHAMLLAVSDIVPWPIVFGTVIAAIVMLISAAMKRKK